MDFIEEIKALALKIPKYSEIINTEEGTKNALIMPFIEILGYDTRDPTEVVPEFTADIDTKNGKKVDYAIFKDDKPIMLIECKSMGSDLNKEHKEQLSSYFHECEAKVGILTNGIVYRFYSDLESTNKIDKKSFLEIDLANIKEPLLVKLNQFKKEAFNTDELTTVARELKYTKEIKYILSEEMNDPSNEFIKFFGSRVYGKNGKNFTKKVQDTFKPLTKEAFSQFIKEQINERLEKAISGEPPEPSKIKVIVPPDKEPEPQKIITTDEERDGYSIVKAILREVVDPNKITMRDTQSYCGILLDDNSHKSLCRLHFNGKQKYISVFDYDDGIKKEEKIPIDNLNGIYTFSDRLKCAARWLNDEGGVKSEYSTEIISPANKIIQ